MKSYLNLIPISAKVHRRQNRMTLICIILSVFLVTAIFSMADMELRSQKIRAISNYGNWHIRLSGITQKDADLLSARTDVAYSSWYEILNYRLDEDYYLGNKKAAVCGVEEELLVDIMQGDVIEGEYPKLENNIIVTQNAKDSLGIEIGDTVTLSIPSGQKIDFIVSGFAMDNMMVSKMDAIAAFMPIDAFRVLYSQATEKELNCSDLVYYIQFKDNINITKSIEDIKVQYGLTDNNIAQNTALLGVMGFSSNSYMQGLYIVAIVLFLLVLTAGILMIASSMNSNIAQRTTFFGMLRCIGADQKQIMRFVRLEALNWCKTAIPIGVIIGVVLTWFMCASLRYLSAKFFIDLPIFGISKIGIFMGIIVGLLTVIIAAQSPAKRAARVSPLTAVSGNAEQTQNIKQAVNTKIMKIHTALGIHHAKQNKKNLILMAGSFAISIVLFLGFSTFIDFMNHAITPLRPYTADVSIVSPNETCSVRKDLVKEIYGREGVKRVYGRMFAYDIPAVINGESKNIMLISYEDYQFNWVDENKWASDKRGLEMVTKDRSEGYVLAAYNPQSSIKEGDKISTSIGELTVAAMLEQCPFSSDEQTEVLVCSEALFTKLTGETDYTIIDVQLKKSATEYDINALRELAGNEYMFSDQRLGNQETKGAYYSFALFIYGFLAVIAMIAVFNIINSISMSVSARMKQYGAMRAVGMEMKQIEGMVKAETYTYAISGIVVGSILGFPLHRFLWNMLISSRWNDPWNIPIMAIIIIITLVFISCFLAVRIPVKRIEDMPVVKVISND